MVEPQNPPAKKNNCLLYGCLGLVAVGILGAAIVFLAVRITKRAVSDLVNNYTETAPAKLERPTFSPEQKAELDKRWTGFREGLEKRGTVGELVLTADDLNSLIADQRELSKVLSVSIDGEKVKGQISLPLQDIGPFKLKGRYLNGLATFDVGLTNGALQVHLEDVTVKDKALPPVFMAEMRKQNFAENKNSNPALQSAVAKFKSIQIKDGKVILRNQLAE